jgi:hypothetical protein
MCPVAVTDLQLVDAADSAECLFGRARAVELGLVMVMLNVRAHAPNVESSREVAGS